MDSAEKQQFYRHFRPWFAAHPASPIYKHQQYDIILSALRQKARGEEFRSNQIEEYNLTCRFILQNDGASPVIISKSSEKQVVCEDDVYDIMLSAHLASNHGRRDTMYKRLANYEGVATRDLIQMFLKGCQTCELASGSVLSEPVAQNSNSFYEASFLHKK
jgi:hypothetical protein